MQRGVPSFVSGAGKKKRRKLSRGSPGGEGTRGNFSGLGSRGRERTLEREDRAEGREQSYWT